MPRGWTSDTRGCVRGGALYMLQREVVVTGGKRLGHVSLSRIQTVYVLYINIVYDTELHVIISLFITKNGIKNSLSTGGGWDGGQVRFSWMVICGRLCRGTSFNMLLPFLPLFFGGNFFL